MADSYIIYVRTDNQTPVPVKAVDNGDGTYSLAVALVGGSAATATPVAAGTEPVEGVVAAATGLRLVGWSITEDAAVADTAEIRIVHGTTVAGGVELFGITLGADESTSQWLGEGIACPNGVSIDRVSGTTRLTLFWKAVG